MTKPKTTTTTTTKPPPGNGAALIARELGSHEFHRLGTLAVFAGRVPDPTRSRVFVIEDKLTGAILGYWCLLSILHAEPLGLEPHLKEHPTLLAEFLAMVMSAAKAESPGGVFFLAETDQSADMARRLGAIAMPGLPFHLPLLGDE